MQVHAHTQNITIMHLQIIALHMYLQYTAYSVGQGTEKGEIYQSAQTEELELVQASNTGALHHPLFPEH